MCEAPLILIVDDQPAVRFLLVELFREAGCRVATASHGQEALALAAAEVPALAFVDLKMPVMDGMETLRELKRLYPALPVVMMTALGEGEVDEALEAGAVACVNKPFDVFEVRRLADRLLEGNLPSSLYRQDNPED